MNATSSPLHGLIWKETRQIRPLVLMLLGVAILLIVLWSLMDSPSMLAQYGHYIPLLLPALVAAGAGAILVGQEKETRTMLWCSSLPIPFATIVGVKFAVALMALVVMWAGCVLMGILVGNRELPGHEAGFSNTLYWIAHSVFILCCGFYTAWRMKNTFASLIALIPLAALPYLATSICYGLLVSDRNVSWKESAWALTAVSTVGFLIMGWLGYRAGVNALEPDRPEIETTGPGSWLAAWRPANSAPVPEKPFRYSISSLVWQSIHHNRLTVTALTIAVLLGSASFAYGSIGHHDGLIILVIVGALATSWLGVFAFHGDGSASRLRFLADRGVSPTRVWVGRQLLGLSVISLATIMYLIACYVSLRPAPQYSVSFLPSAAMFGLTLWIVYSVSQATSQWIRILAASAFLAPVLSVVAATWLFSSAVMYQAPFWLLFLCSVLPMVATWMMMRRFMDDTEKWPIWLTGVATTALFLLLPIVPFIIDVATFPSISTATRAALIAEARRYPFLGNSAQMFSVASPLQDVQSRPFHEDESISKIVEAQRFLPHDYLEIGDWTTVTNVPLRADLGSLSQAIDFAEYFRYLVMQNSGDAEAVESFGKWINALTIIVVRLRMSDRWYDQEVADQVEIWLTQTLSRDELKPLLSSDFSQRAIEVLSNQESRNAARRRAVLLSYRDYYADRDRVEQHDSLGGLYKDYLYQWHPQQKRYWIDNRLVDQLVVDALELLKAAENGQDTVAIRQKLHKLIVDPAAPFTEGPYDVPPNQIKPYFGYGAALYPSSNWFGAWEHQAKQLADD